jgi:class 3 adenylate cyclase/predicted ATPase
VTFEERLNETIALLRRQGRVSYRALKRQFEIDDAYVEDLKAELVEVLGLAADQDGKMLVWKSPAAAVPAEAQPVSSLAGAERRQLTVMFCDLAGSTALSAQLDPEDLRDLLHAYQEATGTVIRRFGGFVAQYLGDGLLVYFGYPQAHEHDAPRAVRAGLEILEAMGELKQARPGDRKPLAVRIGIHTGPVVLSEVGGGGARREELALGETPNIAAKLQALAAPNAVVVSDATLRLVAASFDCQPIGELAIHGKAEPIAAFRIVREREPEHAAAAPVVGRDAEAKLLAERWSQARDGLGQAVLLSGEAGIGKSRLVGLMRDSIAADGGVHMTFRCSPYFTSSALHPLITHLQRLIGLQREDHPEAKLAKLERMLQGYRFPREDTVSLFATLLSIAVPPERLPPLRLSPQQRKRRTADAATSWLLEEAERRPVLMLCEDLHWADPSTLELTSQVIDQIPSAPMLLVATFRPEFTPPWPSRSHVSALTLGRMGRSQVEELVSRITRGKTLPADVVQHIVAKTDGVPLFVEELVKMILESGLVTQQEGSYRLTGPLPAMAIPTTLQDSLMARLDRLDAAREVAQIGAAIGREFSHEFIGAVAQMDDATLERGLSRLVEAELIYRRGQPPAARYTFKHALIRDTAYQSLLKSRRAIYHQRIARVMEERYPEVRETQPELLAHHYTEAGLAEEAVGCWQRAALRGIERSAYVEAMHHLTTALRLHKSLPVTPKTLHQEFVLQTSYGLALTSTKGYAAPELEAAYERAHELSRQVGEVPEIMPLLNGLWSFYLVRAKYQTARELGEQLLRIAEKSRSAVGRIEALRAVGVTLLYPGELEAGLAHLDQAIALYDPARHRMLAFRFTGLDLGVSVLSFAAWASWLLGYPDRALRHSEEMLALARDVGHPYSLAWAFSFSAWVHQYRREPAAARRQAEAAIALAQTQGFNLFAAMGTMFRGWALAASGEAREGIPELRRGIEAYRSTGAESSRAHWLVLLAEAHGAAGEFEAGLRALDEADIERTGERYYEAELHRLRGELLLARGGAASADAERCYQRALEVARAQRARSLELRAAISLSRVKQDAIGIVARAYGEFTEGFDTADLLEASAIVERGKHGRGGMVGSGT